jgi:hypothetical protein
LVEFRAKVEFLAKLKRTREEKRCFRDERIKICFELLIAHAFLWHLTLKKIKKTKVNLK